MKRLLMLGGADIQVSGIKKAKELGYYVITCDYLPNNPGHKYSDEYFNVSTTDKEAVLALAQTLNLDGILAFASDPAAPTAAFVAEKLGLPTNPYQSVLALSYKDKFRELLHSNGFNYPKSKAIHTYEEAYQFSRQLNKEFIIKPVDSSGSKGVYRLLPGRDFEYEFNEALNFSRSKTIIVEEFLFKKGHQIGGDGFMVDGKLAFRCFGDIHFSTTNPMLPCSVSMPSLHTPENIARVHNELQLMLTAAGMQMGALNFDVIIDENDEVYILEVGPRNGGNMLPELIKYVTGVDMVEASIRAAVGDPLPELKIGEEKRFYSHYVVHAQENGKISEVKISSNLEEHLLYHHFNFSVGDKVNKFRSSNDRLGIMLLKYSDKHEMLDFINNMNEFLKLDIAK
jgi:biotin carboxylase